MSNLRNKVQLIGHLGADPTVKEFEKDKKIALFSLATKDVFYTKEGERKEIHNGTTLYAGIKTQSPLVNI